MAVNPVLVLALPLAYIGVSVLIMMQFSALLSLLAQGALKVRSMRQLDIIEPVVSSIVDYFQRVFGPLNKFSPQPTHVLLVAVIVAVVVNGQRTSRR